MNILHGLGHHKEFNHAGRKHPALIVDKGFHFPARAQKVHGKLLIISAYNLGCIGKELVFVHCPVCPHQGHIFFSRHFSRQSSSLPAVMVLPEEGRCHAPGLQNHYQAKKCNDSLDFRRTANLHFHEQVLE